MFQKAHWEILNLNRIRHHIEPSFSLQTIQSMINDAGVDDVIEFASGTFGDGQTLEITKNLHICGQGMNQTILKCNLVVKQDGCSGGGKVTVRKLKVQGVVNVTSNTFDDVSFVSVLVDAGRSTLLLTP